MRKKELKIQNALGLIKTYEGYIRIDDSNDFILFHIKAPTYKSARHRLKNICKYNKEYTLEYMQELSPAVPSWTADINIVETREASV